MSDVNLPRGVQVIWQLQRPSIGPHHTYFEVPDQQTFDRLQVALKERGLPPVRLLPLYRRREDDRVVALGACVCHTHEPSHPVLALIDFVLPDLMRDRIARCASELALPIVFISVGVLAENFGVPSDYRLLYNDLYHWDPWEHQWRLEEVNDILLRYGLPKREKLEFQSGRRILCVLGIWKDQDGKGVWVRYAVAEANGERAYTRDIRYEQSHDVLVCLAAGGKIAVTVQVDEMREWQTWRFLKLAVSRKPTNEALHGVIAPGVSSAKLSVSSLGDCKGGGRRRIFRLVRLRASPDELVATRPHWAQGITWKSWGEILTALGQGFLDHDTELVVNRLLRRFPKQEELLGTT